MNRAVMAKPNCMFLHAANAFYIQLAKALKSSQINNHNNRFKKGGEFVKMGDLETIIFTAASLAGIIITVYLGYRTAKKADPSVTFDFDAFINSLFRAAPGILTACAAGAFAVNFSGMTLLAILLLVVMAFNSGTASDVALKRSWSSLTSKAASGSVVAQSTVAAVAKVQAKARLMFLWSTK
jgi:hypothetical protein